MKAPVSHIFSTTNHFLASRIRGFLCLRTDCQWVDSLLTGSFVVLWAPVETDGSFCSALCRGPSAKADLLAITRSGEASLESSRIVEAGLWCYRACRYHSWWHWSPLQFKTLSEEQPFAFCWHLYWEMPFLEAFLHNSVTVCLSQVEGKCLLPTGSCIFDTRNSLHKQRSAWAWSEPAPEEHCCWLILHAPCAKLNI